MNKRKWDETVEALREVAATPAPKPAAEFWAEFRARAALVNQDQPAARPAWHGLWVWASATAGLAALLVAVGLVTWQQAPTAASPALALAMNEVRMLDVQATHTGVIVIQDSQNHGTIVFVTGMVDQADGED